MKVTEISVFSGERVSFDSEHPYDYVRYGPESWYQCYGDTDEFVYNDALLEKLEKAYQEYIK